MPVTVCFAKRVCEEFLGKESNVSFSNSFDFITNRKIPYCLYSLILTAGQILLKLRVQAENKLISCPVEIVCFFNFPFVWQSCLFAFPSRPNYVAGLVSKALELFSHSIVTLLRGCKYQSKYGFKEMISV